MAEPDDLFHVFKREVLPCGGEKGASTQRIIIASDPLLPWSHTVIMNSIITWLHYLKKNGVALYSFFDLHCNNLHVVRSARTSFSVYDSHLSK